MITTRRTAAAGSTNRQNLWRIRPSVPQDIDRMYDVWYASVVATHDFLAESDLIEISVLVRRDYLPNHSFLVGMDGEDRVVGFMGMTGQEIDSLFIDPAYRAKGLGRALVAVAASKTTGLEVEVNAQNLQAIGFYQALGFRVISSSPVDDCGRPYPILRMRLHAFNAPA